MASPLEVRLQALDGTWETIGVDRYPGVSAEGFQAGSNEGGYDTCSFVLKRPTDVQHPDLSSFTPCEIYRGGSFLWEGRIRETPTTDGPDGQINVTGVGWQAHLDDDQYEATYVQTDLGVWRDSRSFLIADLSRFRQNGRAEVGDGVMVVGFPPNTVAAAGDGAGVTVDLGPDPRRWCRRIAMLLDASPNDAANRYYIRGHDAENSQLGAGAVAGSFEDVTASGGFWNTLAAQSTVATAGTWITHTFIRPFRFFSIYAYAVGALVAATDYALRVKQALLFRDPAYEAANVSTLKAPTIIRDALDTVCPLLSLDRSQIDPNGQATFVFPDFALDGPKTARDVIQAVNAVHRWRTRIKRNRVPEFAPQPNAPLFKVGAWGGSKFQDASAGSGEEIYNRVLVTGTSPDGVALTVERRSPNPAVQPSNPSAAVDTSGWSTAGTGATLARDTGVFDSAPASFKLSHSINQNGAAQTTVNQPVVAGRRYRVTLAVRRDYIGNTGPTWLTLYVNVGGTVATARVLRGPATAVGGAVTMNDTVANTWQLVSFDWLAPFSAPSFVLNVDAQHSAAWNVWFDSIVVDAYEGSLVDARGFIRTMQLPIQSALTVPLANQIGDVFLAAHARTPLKGSIDVSPGGLRSVATDEPIHPSELLNHPTELIRLAHLVDPDTGAVGRDGIIATVAYTEENEIATVQLDNDRQSFQALLQRMAIVMGSG